VVDFVICAEKKSRSGNIIPIEIQGENYIFDSNDCVRIFQKLNAVYGNILIEK